MLAIAIQLDDDFRARLECLAKPGRCGAAHAEVLLIEDYVNPGVDHGLANQFAGLFGTVIVHDEYPVGEIVEAGQ